ncbi:WD-40 repeat-containing protein, partial [Reticulomyxa filosa]
QTIFIEVEKLKKHLQDKLNQINAKDDEIRKMKDDIQTFVQIVQAKEGQLLEKDNEIKKLQRSTQQKLLKIRADFELMQRDFMDKEKQIIQYEKVVKLLEEKNESLASDYQKLSQMQHINNKDERKENSQSGNVASSSSNFNIKFSGLIQLLKKMVGHSDIVRSIDFFSLDETLLLCSASQDKTVRVWDVDTGRQLKVFKGHRNEVLCAKFSICHYNYGPSVICSASMDKTIRFWDFKTDKQLQVLHGHTDGIFSLQFSPFTGGRYLCSGSRDKTIRLWDVDTYKSLYVLSGHVDTVSCVAFSPRLSNNANANANGNGNNNGDAIIGGSGYTLCSGSRDNTVRLWDIETAKELIVFKGHENWVNEVKYSQKEAMGNIIYSVSHDKTIRLWDIRSKTESAVLKGHTNSVFCVEYLPFGADRTECRDEHVICSGARDNTVRFWDVRNNKQLVEIKGYDNDQGIFCLQFWPLKGITKDSGKPDGFFGNYLCYGSLNGHIRLLG